MIKLGKKYSQIQNAEIDRLQIEELTTVFAQTR
jgi:hypothetical protein